MPDEKRIGQAVPAAVASAIAHRYGKDIVIVFTLDCVSEMCHATSYGRTDRDKVIAERLAGLLARGLHANPQPEEVFVVCPTCDAPMQSIGYVHVHRRVYWCSRCGTLRYATARSDHVPHDHTPALVERCREFEAVQVADSDAPLTLAASWHALGVAEAINVPARRPA